jgi:threonine/homoserine/homoserine lactone efflux protein
VIERRARWERALACTREQLVLEICSSLVFLVAAIGLRPRPSSALVVLFGFAVGIVVHGCSRLLLALPPLVRKVEWDSEPRSPSPARSFSAGLLVAVLTLLAIAAVYTSTGHAVAGLFAFFGGMFLAYTLITAAQRFYLERDFARRLSGR